MPGDRNTFEKIRRKFDISDISKSSIRYPTNLDSGVVAVQDGRVEVALDADVVACNVILCNIIMQCYYAMLLCNVMQPHLQTYRYRTNNIKHYRTDYRTDRTNRSYPVLNSDHIKHIDINAVLKVFEHTQGIEDIAPIQHIKKNEHIKHVVKVSNTLNPPNLSKGQHRTHRIFRTHRLPSNIPNVSNTTNVYVELSNTSEDLLTISDI